MNEAKMRPTAIDFRPIITPTKIQRSPCDSCPLQSDCETNQKACSAYFVFVTRGEYTPRTPRMIPTRKMFDWTEREENAA